MWHIPRMPLWGPYLNTSKVTKLLMCTNSSFDVVSLCSSTLSELVFPLVKILLESWNPCSWMLFKMAVTYLKVDNVWKSVALQSSLQSLEQPKVSQCQIWWMIKFCYQFLDKSHEQGHCHDAESKHHAKIQSSPINSIMQECPCFQITMSVHWSCWRSSEWWLSL